MWSPPILLFLFGVVFAVLPVVRKVGDERVHRVNRRRLGRILLVILVVKEGENVPTVVAARCAAGGVEVVVATTAAVVTSMIVPSRITHFSC
jgi:uncharacterized membrane protein